MKYALYGAILGDLAGQPYEFPVMKHFPENVNLHNPDSKITDDTLMTLATAKSIIDNQNIEDAYKEMGLKYQGDYYGKGFKEWLKSDKGTIGNSYGNGCLMRISPFFYLENLKHEEIELKVIESCLTSHCNPISISYSIKLCDLYFQSKLRRMCSVHKYEAVPFTKFEVRADKTFQFVDKIYGSHKSTHEAIKKSIKCGGDTDTNASIIGELMNFTYNDLNREDLNYVESKLDDYLLKILLDFSKLINKI